MIQKLREKLSGVVALGLIILIAIPLAFFGVESIFLNSTRVSDVAEVNGEEINEIQLARAQAAQQEQLLQILGNSFDPSIFESPALRAQALQTLIDQTVIYTQARDAKMGVSEAYVGSQISSLPDFQVAGEFSEVALRNYLSQMGFTVTTFMEQLGREYTRNQLISGVQGSTLITDSEFENLLALTRETRSYEYLRLSVDELLASVSVSEEDILNYYENNQSAFQVPERVQVSYIELSLPALEQAVEIDEAELEARIEGFVAEQGEERRAAHILIDTGEGADAAIAEIQQQLAEGVAFADLAAEYSVDIGSATTGGDLGFTSGSTFPEEFESALAELEVGEVSDPVETSSGIHLIQLTEVSENELDVAAEAQSIEQAMRADVAQEQFLGVFDSMQDLAFSTDNLEQLQQGLSDLIDLPIQSSELFSREAGTGIAENIQVRNIAFSDIVLEEQLNSEVISLSAERAVVVHVADRQPAQIQPLDEVRGQITSTLAQERATSLLAETAADLLQQAREGQSLEAIARSEDIEWQVSLSQSRGNLDEIGREVFALPLGDGLPVVEGFSLDSGDYVLARLNEVEPGRVSVLTQAQQGSAKLSLRQSTAASEWAAYMAAIRNQADIEIKIDLPETGTF